ncbi:MAG: metallophosphoesterase [Bacteroidaceae bacterium]|nr:metallophosphoesterase [Prevotellaceae bacterium]MDY5632325.1 metallophosphoesterase [Bacteroidaceae bacterium]
MMKKLILCLMPCLLMACGDVFQVHPYDVRFNGETNILEHHIAEIQARCGHKDTLRVAFVSDTHGWYSDAKDEVASINRRENLDFVIHLGDLTDTGTTKEFVWIRRILDGLRLPYVTLIGNHDFLGTGNQTYGQMFGPVDFSFIVSRIKFVCLNTNATEYDHMAAVPNFDFMEREATADTALFDRTILLMHAPPYGDQFNNNVVKAFQRYTWIFPQLMFCAYGHNHRQAVNDIYHDGVLYYGVDCAENRNYYVFTLTPDGYEYEIVYF